LACAYTGGKVGRKEKRKSKKKGGSPERERRGCTQKWMLMEGVV
jgi:hypothetical protein